MCVQYPVYAGVGAVKVMTESRKTQRSVITLQPSAALRLREPVLLPREADSISQQLWLFGPSVTKIGLVSKGWSQARVIIENVFLKCEPGFTRSAWFKPAPKQVIRRKKYFLKKVWPLNFWAKAVNSDNPQSCVIKCRRLASEWCVVNLWLCKCQRFNEPGTLAQCFNYSWPGGLPLRD